MQYYPISLNVCFKRIYSELESYKSGSLGDDNYSGEDTLGCWIAIWDLAAAGFWLVSLENAELWLVDSGGVETFLG